MRWSPTALHASWRQVLTRVTRNLSRHTHNKADQDDEIWIINFFTVWAEAPLLVLNRPNLLQFSLWISLAGPSPYLQLGSVGGVCVCCVSAKMLL